MAIEPAPNTDTKPYTIDLPGFRDVIAYPNKDNTELRRQQIERFRSAHHALPEPLNWVPGAINWLDDIQDYLITALHVAYPLLRRLPNKWIPYLGWALAISDVLNIVNNFLSISTAGPRAKAEYFQDIKNLAYTKQARMQRAVDFLSHFNWKAAIIQGAQVSYNLTGYGLKLGGIFGAISDAFWGLFRMAQGHQLVIRAPPPADPLGKAFRVLSQGHYLYKVSDFLTTESTEMILVGHAQAVGEILAQKALGALGGWAADRAERMAIAAMDKVPIFNPWNELSRQQLAAAGFDPDAEQGLPTAEGPRSLTQLQDANVCYTQAQSTEEALAAALGNTALASALQQVYNDTGLASWELATDQPDTLKVVYSPEEVALAQMIEFNCFPPGWPGTGSLPTDFKGLKYPPKFALMDTSAAAMKFYADTYNQATEHGLHTAGFPTVRYACLRTWGGFLYRPYTGGQTD